MPRTSKMSRKSASQRRSRGIRSGSGSKLVKLSCCTQEVGVSRVLRSRCTEPREGAVPPSFSLLRWLTCSPISPRSVELSTVGGRCQSSSCRRLRWRVPR